jgi:hypothetical protein
MTEPQAAYSIARNVYRLVIDLAGPDPYAIDGGLVVAYTRNHELAAFLAAHSFTVNWKPYLKTAQPLRMATGGVLCSTTGQALARFEAEIDAPLGTRLVWLAPEVQEDIRRAEAKEESYAR